MSGDFDDTRPRWPERDLGRERDRERDREFEQQPPQEPPPAEPPPEPTYEPPEEPPYQPAYVRPPDPPYRSPYQPEYEAPPEPERPEPGPEPSPETEATETTTTLGDSTSEPEAGAEGDPGDWDPGRDGDRRRPTTAEQAVPWLIGMLLALAGIVVVLMALIFIGPEGVAGLPSGSPSPSISAAPSASPTPIGSPTPIPTAAPTVTPPPTFGALEMTYLGRAKAATPIRLLRHDFATTTAAAVLAEDPAGVRAYAWAPDGRDGVAIIAGRAVAVVAGKPLRTLTGPVDAVVFGDDSSALYGLRIVRGGTNDRAEVLSIQFGTGATQIISAITYPHPEIIADPALKEAQFADNGGLVRLWMSTDGSLVAWILGAPSTYRIDPAAHTFTTVARAPVLWSPDQRLRVDVTEKSGSTTLSLFDSDDTGHGSVKVTGLVSHVRWAGSNNEIAFTLGRLVGGGVRQDLYVWDLQNGKAPSALTSNGASFGAEWLGVLQSWVP